MSASNLHPSESRLLAFLDGELPHPDAESVRTHLADCRACQSIHSELQSVREALTADSGSDPLRPVWPAIADELRPKPRFTPSFALGTVAAMVAGVFLGLTLGTREPASPALDVNSSDVWSSVGSSLGTDAGLYGAYFADSEGSSL